MIKKLKKIKLYIKLWFNTYIIRIKTKRHFFIYEKEDE